MKSLIRKFLYDQNGVAAIIFAFSIPMIIGAAGISVDVAKAYLVKQHLGHAVDAAALAGASTGLTGAKLEDFVKTYAINNFKNDSGGAILEDSDIKFKVTNKNVIEVTATATSINTFMPFSFFSKDSVTVTSTSKVNKAIGVEVVMALDNSGSMNKPIVVGGSQSRIDGLKVALHSFTNILQSKLGEHNNAKIGIVPWSASVNVGDRGMGNSTIPSADKFVVNQIADGSIIPFNSNIESNDWGGCILEDRTHLTEDYAGPYAMYRNHRKIDPDLTKNRSTYYTDQLITPEKGSWRKDLEVGWPNFKCVSTPLLPLTDDFTAVRNKIDEMDTSYEGATVGSIGMAWAWRVISSDPPFTEGANYNDPDWKKFVILMTDGRFNTSGEYGGYGQKKDKQVNSDDSVHNNNNKYTRDKIEEICEKMKASGRDITIYTINFNASPESEEVALLKDCQAMPGDKGFPRYIHAKNNDELEDAFEVIANQISNTYLSE